MRGTQSRMAHTRLLNQRIAWWLSAVFRDNNLLTLEEFENLHTRHRCMVSIKWRGHLLFSGVDFGTCAWSKRWDALNLVVRASHGQSAERASVVMLLLVFGQQIYSPILLIFIVFGLVCSDCCTFCVELMQLKDLGKCLILAILDGLFYYPVLYLYYTSTMD